LPLSSLRKRIDDRGLKASLEIPRTIEFDLGAELAFGSRCSLENVSMFSDWSFDAVCRGNYFEGAGVGMPLDARSDNTVRFSSDLVTETPENNEFEVCISEASVANVAVIMFHHWFATNRYSLLGKFLAARGITFVEATLPYHFGRSPSGHNYAERFVSPNIGLTIRSMKQATVDGRKIVDWLHRSGYKKIFVSGICLGSWIAGLVAANDRRISGASLWLAGGSAADVVWTSRSTGMIRDKISPFLDLETLRKLWAVIDLNHHVLGLARKPMQFVVAKHDEIVQASVSDALIENLRRMSNQPQVINVNSGHASLSVPPYNIQAALSLARFVKKHSK